MLRVLLLMYMLPVAEPVKMLLKNYNYLFPGLQEKKRLLNWSAYPYLLVQLIEPPKAKYLSPKK